MGESVTQRASVAADPFVLPLTTYIDQAGAVDTVTRMLGEHRLLTLTGSGGCGKTRLAIQVAAGRVSRFADGGVFVDLAPVDAAGVVPSAVAAAAGVPEAGAASVPVLLANAWAGRRLLVVLDNCEQVVDACAELFHGLLAHCAGLAVLATSRTPLGIDGEATWRVPSLSLPPAGADDPRAAVTGSEAGRLLLDRARLADPAFELSAGDAAAMVSLCRRLDGIPLAIELAARRLRAFTPADLVAGLENRFQLLSSGARTAPPRQRTLEASIAWSHDLLDDTERRLFRRLAVFAPGFDVAALEAVCVESLPVVAVRPALAALVDQSLVEHHGGNRGRFRLLETVRAYALACLIAAGEEPALRDRHLDNVREATRRFDALAEDAILDEANRRIDAMLDEVRSALEWSVRSGRVADGLDVAADLRMFWITASRLHEGRSWLDALLGVEQPLGAEARGRALLATSQVCLFATDPFSQYERASEALTIARRLGDQVMEARALVLAGWAQVFLDPTVARELLGPGLALAEQIDDIARVEFGSLGLGTAATLTGQLDEAVAALSKGIDVAERRGTFGRHFGRAVLGYVRVLRGELADAVAGLAETAALPGGDFDRTGRDLATTYLAAALVYRGEYDRAREHVDEAIASARAVGNPAVYGLLHSALLEHALGNHPAAVAHLDECGIVLELPGFAWFKVQALGIRARAAAVDDVASASELWRQAMSTAQTTANPLARSVAGLGLARAAVLEGDEMHARTLAQDALRAAVGAGYRIGAIDALEALAVLAGPDAAPLLAAVDAERSRIGYVRFPIDEPSYEAAVRVDGTRADEAVASFDEAVALAQGGDARPARPPSGWASLTPAEVRVARLVAEGLTNPEIGARLFISRRTVQAHLAHIFDKLQLANRAELAAVVSDQSDRDRK